MQKKVKCRWSSEKVWVLVMELRKSRGTSNDHPEGRPFFPFRPDRFRATRAADRWAAPPPPLPRKAADPPTPATKTNLKITFFTHISFPCAAAHGP